MALYRYRNPARLLQLGEQTLFRVLVIVVQSLEFRRIGLRRQMVKRELREQFLRFQGFFHFSNDGVEYPSPSVVVKN